MSTPLSDSHKRDLSALLEQYLADTRLPPQPGSKRLVIADLPCGWVFPKALQALDELAMPDILNCTDHVVTVGAGLSITRDADRLNTQLANLALHLRQSGCCPAWRDELLDVWSDETSVAAIERGAVRPLGLTTRAVHLNARRANGDIWVARRDLKKLTDPGLWDTLVGGLVGYGEPDDLALMRESEEEAGLTLEDIQHRQPIRQVNVMRRQLPEGYQVERVLTSACVLDDQCVPLNQDGEVMEIRCVTPRDITDMLLAKQFTVEATIVIAEQLLRPN